MKYDSPQNFTTTGYIDENGVLNGNYGTYSGNKTPIQMSRDFVMVPNEPFMVVKYALTNPSATKSYNWNVLDQVHLNNTNNSDNVSGSYDSTRNTLFANMTASGQYVVFLGAMQTASSYQVGNDSDCTASDSTASAWCQFDANGTLHDNSSLSTPNMNSWLPKPGHHRSRRYPDALLLPRDRPDNNRRANRCLHRRRPDRHLLVFPDGVGLLDLAGRRARRSRPPTPASTPPTCATSL